MKPHEKMKGIKFSLCHIYGSRELQTLGIHCVMVKPRLAIIGVMTWWDVRVLLKKKIPMKRRFKTQVPAIRQSTLVCKWQTCLVKASSIIQCDLCNSRVWKLVMIIHPSNGQDMGSGALQRCSLLASGN